MPSFPRTARGFPKSSTIVSAAAALMLAGCSSAMERFSENPSDADPVYTASVPKPKAMAAAEDDDVVSSRPLSSSRNANYRPPQYKQTAAARPAGEGTVEVGNGMTLYSIARSHGLTVAELAAANEIPAPFAVHPGQVLRIPDGGGRAVALAKPLSSGRKLQESGATHRVASGDTFYSLGRKYGVPPYAIADLNGLGHSTSLSLGQSLKIPVGGGASRVAAAKPGVLSLEPPAEPKEQAVAEATPVPAKPLASVAEQMPPPDAAAEPDLQQEAALPAEPVATGMRWPVRGKIISNFGSKPNGLKNEGINIAVPEGTSIRAAESGVVAYSGNELKGYGNLVLIRHEGGWVTAYAHAKDLFVKRGDTVKRGDVIAKAGQTGSVSSPQLHFEVRKGATAMDPIKYLSSATASN